MGVSCLTVLAVQLWAAGYSLELLTGVAAATLLHAAVGAWQWFAFRDGHLPLVELYANPSFLSVQENADTIARYIRRPFGLFPEPSAMSSSLAPWVLFWAAEAGGLLRLRREPARWQRRLFAAAAAGGLGLIILSQSGHAAVTLAAMAVFAAAWFVRRRATAGAYVAVVFAFAVVLPVVLWFAFDSLSNRVGGASDLGNSSWEDRSTSLVLGLQLWLQDVPTLVLGTGVGMTSPALQRSAHLEAVWSVLLTYVYETGFVGPDRDGRCGPAPAEGVEGEWVRARLRGHLRGVAGRRHGDDQLSAIAAALADAWVALCLAGVVPEGWR